MYGRCRRKHASNQQSHLGCGRLRRQPEQARGATTRGSGSAQVRGCRTTGFVCGKGDGTRQRSALSGDFDTSNQHRGWR